METTIAAADNPAAGGAGAVPDAGECPISRALNLIAAKWTVPIIYHLHRAGSPVRFRQLQRLIPPITQKELTRRLRELERLGLVHRQVFAEVPPRVEYRLTETGRTLEAPLKALADWVERHGHILEAPPAPGDH
jgi:DNA-binding HxlR family transcriptional regulator